MWEGLGVTAKHLLIISPVLEKFKGRVKLRIISDRYYKLGGLFQKNVLDIFSNAKFDFEFYDWEKETFSSLIAESDIAVIPLDTSDKLALDKPENKLILFWQHGMPTMTSDIPTYRDAFSKIDLDLTCNNSDQWEKKIEFFLSGKFDYNQHMNSVNKYIDHFRSQKQFIKAWNNIFIDALKLSDRNN